MPADTHTPNLETIMYRLGSLEMSLGNLSEKLDGLSRYLMEQPKCPAPGACIALRTTTEGQAKDIEKMREELKELTQRVDTLEKAGEYQRGVGKGLLIAVGALGGLAGSVATFIIKRLFGA